MNMNYLEGFGLLTLEWGGRSFNLSKFQRFSASGASCGDPRCLSKCVCPPRLSQCICPQCPSVMLAQCPSTRSTQSVCLQRVCLQCRPRVCLPEVCVHCVCLPSVSLQCLPSVCLQCVYPVSASVCLPRGSAVCLSIPVCPQGLPAESAHWSMSLGRAPISATLPSASWWQGLCREQCPPT